MQKSRRAIKQVLLDSSIVAGMGNIYACEALWAAKIKPTSPANLLTETQLLNLLNCSIAIINRAIKLGGTTYDGKYVHVDGFAGGYQNELQVYGREGQPCSRCGGEIKKTKIGGRGTWYCISCQK